MGLNMYLIRAALPACLQILVFPGLRSLSGKEGLAGRIALPASSGALGPDAGKRGPSWVCGTSPRFMGTPPPPSPSAVEPWGSPGRAAARRARPRG